MARLKRLRPIIMSLLVGVVPGRLPPLPAWYPRLPSFGSSSTLAVAHADVAPGYPAVAVRSPAGRLRGQAPPRGAAPVRKGGDCRPRPVPAPAQGRPEAPSRWFAQARLARVLRELLACRWLPASRPHRRPASSFRPRGARRPSAPVGVAWPKRASTSMLKNRFTCSVIITSLLVVGVQLMRHGSARCCGSR